MSVAAQLLEQDGFPPMHLEKIGRFIAGEEMDAKRLFRLTDDLWPVGPYANAAEMDASRYNLRFTRYRSFLLPYVKAHLYDTFIVSGHLTQTAGGHARALASLDTIAVDMRLTSLFDLASSTTMDAIEQRLDGAQWRVVPANRFLQWCTAEFGVPARQRPMRIHHRERPPAAYDESRLVPVPVRRQVDNVLRLHRAPRAKGATYRPLHRYDHMRVCILVLLIATGRRMGEMRLVPRCSGAEGPLVRKPTGGLWLRFRPEKHGPGDEVYISPEWEDVVTYAVRKLIGYSDPVRHRARPAEQGLLILGARSAKTRRNGPGPDVAGVSHGSFEQWANGGNSGWTTDARRFPGFFARFGITVEGTSDSAIYHFRSHAARHTRQTALVETGEVPAIAAQFDLNHRNPDMQAAYQHHGRALRDRLVRLADEGRLAGPAAAVVRAVSGGDANMVFGQPKLMDGRWRDLVARSPQLIEFTRVPVGYCTLAQGPSACLEMMQCTTAADRGCQHLLTDPEDVEGLNVIAREVVQARDIAAQAQSAGRRIQAEKHTVIAERAEAVIDDALLLANADVTARIRTLLRRDAQP